jgi:hypothetical protein
MRTIGRWLSATVEHSDYLLTLARLAGLDWLFPPEETLVDRPICERGAFAQGVPRHRLRPSGKLSILFRQIRPMTIRPA